MPALASAGEVLVADRSLSFLEDSPLSPIGIRQTVLLVILFILVAVGLIALDNSSVLSPLRTGLRNVTDPVVSWIDRVSDRNKNTTPIEIQLEQVTRERDQLLAENAQLKSQMESVAKLQDVLGMQEAHPTWKLVTARVLNADPSGLQKLVTIDRGSADGIQIGMAVTDPNYLVGYVTAVEEHSARVTLAIDGTFFVGAKLLDSKGVGIAYGRWQYGERMELRYVSRDVTPEKNEIVVTSDESDSRTSQVPPSIIIGRISGEPVVDNQSDSQTIQILPAADFDNLSIVAVIVTDGGGSGNA